MRIGIVRVHGNTLNMWNKRSNLLARIESGLLKEKPLDALLRELVVLGGNVGSPELRAWASLELRGYGSQDELPPYRKLTAPLQIDGSVPGALVRHQTIGYLDLPDFARDEFSETVPLRMGVKEIQSVVNQHRSDRTVALQPPGAADVVSYMNMAGELNGHINALYWSVSTIAFEGVLDQIRTRLAELIAELRSEVSSRRDLPSPTQAANAVSLVITGRGNRVNIAQASDGSTATVADTSEDHAFWTHSRRVGAAVVGLATVVGTTLSAIQIFR